MDTNNYYLLVILVILIAVAAILFVWLKRDRGPAPGSDADATPTAVEPAPEPRISPAEALIDPILAAPPEVAGIDAVRAAPVPVAQSAPAPAPADVAPAAPAADEGPADTLTVLKGLGPKAATRLNDLGITRFAQLAALSPEAAAAIDAQMGPFQGRMARDRWIEQAGHLAQGDVAGFEAKFGKIGG